MHRTFRHALAGAAAVGLAAAGVLIAPLTASAAVIPPVDTLSDNPADGFTFREAVTLANTDTAADTITFVPALTGNIVLGSTVTATEGLTINGNEGLTLTRDPSAGDFDLFFFNLATTGQSITVDNLDFAGSTDLPLQVGYAFVAQPNGLGVDLASVTLRNVGIFNFLGPIGNEGAGAFIFGADTVLIEDSGFTSNQASAGRWGAGVYFAICGDVTIRDSVFESNLAAAGGAIMGLTTESVSIEGSTFLLNRGDVGNFAGGGAVYLDNIGPGSIEIGTSRFLENSSAGVGGAIKVQTFAPEGDAAMTVTDTLFQDSTAGETGGAIELVNFDGPATFTRTTFERNTAADGEGGAIDVYDDPNSSESEFPSITISQSSFLSNKAAENGGAVHVSQVHPDSKLTVTQSTFARNDLTRDGRRGVSLQIGDNDGVVEISDSTFDEAIGEDVDYAVYMSSNDEIFNVASSTIIGPGALGVFGSDGDVTVTNTILDGGPEYVYADFTMSLDEANATVSYLLLKQPLQGGIVNDGGVIVAADHGLQPLGEFGGPTLTRLPLTTSPAVNAGDPAYVGPLTEDQRLLPRVVDGRIDIGAVERQPNDPPDPVPPLPATGSAIPLWIPIAGGVVLLFGFAAIAFTVVSRRRLNG